MKTLLTLLITFSALSACSVKNNHKIALYTPLKAIELSNQMAPRGLKGDFVLTVNNLKQKNQLNFLYSENDCMDQRNLIIVLRPNALKELSKIHNLNAENLFKGKTIKVQGVAKRIKTWHENHGRKTNNYFYQTQVFVKSAKQITFI